MNLSRWYLMSFWGFSLFLTVALNICDRFNGGDFFFIRNALVMTARFIESSLSEEDIAFEVPLRPQSLGDFFGAGQTARAT